MLPKPIVTGASPLARNDVSALPGSYDGSSRNHQPVGATHAGQSAGGGSTFGLYA